MAEAAYTVSAPRRLNKTIGRHCLETTRLVEIGVLPRCFPGPAVDKIRAAAGEKYTFHKLLLARTRTNATAAGSCESAGSACSMSLIDRARPICTLQRAGVGDRIR